MKRIFVGIPIPEMIKEQIRPFVNSLEEIGTDLNLVPLQNLHFTIKFLGDVDEDELDGIKEKLIKVATKHSHFNISLKKIGAFPSKEMIKVIWIGAESKMIIPLMKEVNQELDYIKKNDFKEEIPHLTIARVKSGRNKEELQGWIKEVEDNEFGTMVVDKIVLYESILTSKGPIYDELASFNLKSAFSTRVFTGGLHQHRH